MDELMHVVNFVLYLFNPLTEPVFLLKEKILMYTMIWGFVWFVILPDSKVAEKWYDFVASEFDGYYRSFGSPLLASIIYSATNILVGVLVSLFVELFWRRALPGIVEEGLVTFFWVLMVAMFVWYNAKQISYRLLEEKMRSEPKQEEYFYID